MKALITGIAGFAGSHLAENLLAHDIKVCGTALKGESLKNLKGVKADISLVRASLDDVTTLSRFITSNKPNLIFHLAALASVGQSFSAPEKTMAVNLLGTLKLYELLRGRKYVENIVFVSSADIFGPLSPTKMPIKPDYPLRPVSPYGASKAAADLVSYQYYCAFGLPIVRVRAFNHTGPRQQTGFVIPDFCSQIAAIESGKGHGIIRVGDLSARRDLADVRDIVNGYRLASQRGRAGESYILASGKADKISSYLKILINHSPADIKIKTDRKLLRPVEVPLLVGSISKAKRQLGFKPRIKIEKTLLDTLEYWRRN
ncbi:MAG: GDP-mannose 4,6-dehydratase [candidate division Zixibacteria bacterium]|nr:GDP-mannose 4,6-dehydratase [candidate division Zixibacteria bacterium]